MPTLAEQLRNEMPDIHKEMPWLRESVYNNIKYYGEYNIICDTHVSYISERFAVPSKYWIPIEEWAKSEGLRVYASYNSYGVKNLCISL